MLDGTSMESRAVVTGCLKTPQWKAFTVTGPTALKVAIVIYENSASDLARAYRGLSTAREMVDAGDDVTVIYDGSGVDTLAAASASDHKLHKMVEFLRPVTRGACAYCATAHGVEEVLVEAKWPLLSEYRNHASVRMVMAEGYQVLTF